MGEHEARPRVLILAEGQSLTDALAAFLDRDTGVDIVIIDSEPSLRPDPLEASAIKLDKMMRDVGQVYIPRHERTHPTSPKASRRRER